MNGCALLDTHTLLWATGMPERLSERARGILEDEQLRLLVSHATVWELSIKASLGKVRLPDTFFESLPELGYEILPLRDEHFAAYRRLPLLHRDPFDRMLVAQARAESLTILSADREIHRYEVEWIW